MGLGGGWRDVGLGKKSNFKYFKFVVFIWYLRWDVRKVIGKMSLSLGEMLVLEILECRWYLKLCNWMWFLREWM